MEFAPEVELTGIRRLSEEEFFIGGKEDEAPNGDNEPGAILKPGSKIRPIVNEEEAIHLAESIYGITTKDIKELVSYDDKNFLIRVDT